MKLITYLRSKYIPKIKSRIRQWIKRHIIDDVDPNDLDF